MVARVVVAMFSGQNKTLQPFLNCVYDVIPATVAGIRKKERSC